MEEGLGLICKRLEGRQSLAKLNNTFYGKKFTGYVKTRLVDSKGMKIGGISVYRTGEPIIAYTCRGDIKTIDPGQQAMSSMISDETEKTEIFLLSEGQVQSLSSTYGEFTIKTPARPEDMALPDRSLINAIMADPPADLSKINGRFVKAVSVDNIKNYLASLPIDTGYIAISLKNSGEHIEYHVLVIYGQILGAFRGSANVGWPDLIDRLSGKAGVVELYYLGDSDVKAILDKYPAIAAYVNKKVEAKAEKKAPKKTPEQPKAKAKKADIKPAAEVKQDTVAGHIQAEPPKEIEASFEALPDDIKNHPDATDNPEINFPLAATEEELKLVKDIEQDFLSNVDEMLSRLKLTHLKNTPRRNKVK